MDKLEVARRQLGTALWLFLEDREPLAVQSLASGAGEILDDLASQAGVESSSAHILRTNPQMNFADVKRLRNLYWNAFKHATSRRGTMREDQELLDAFSDKQNDAALILAWMDYHRVSGRLPVAAQVFQHWFFAVYEEKLAAHVNRAAYRLVFPEIGSKDRRAQKALLRTEVARRETDANLLAHHETEPSLLLPVTD